MPYSDGDHESYKPNNLDSPHSETNSIRGQENPLLAGAQQASDSQKANSQFKGKTKLIVGTSESAEKRLRNHISDPSSAFTSNLSANEWLLVRKAGFQPISQVMGASVYLVDLVTKNLYKKPRNGGDIPEASREHVDAWKRTCGRLAQEARLCGGNAVTGVKVSWCSLDLSEQEAVSKGSTLSSEDIPLTEISLIGTAGKLAQEDSSAPTVLTTLTGQELYQLKQAGGTPAGIVYGCSVYYQPFVIRISKSDYPISTPIQWNLNQEMTDYTNGFIAARRLAVERLQGEIAAVRGTGVVDVSFHISVLELGAWEYYDTKTRIREEHERIIITAEVVGTAIRIDSNHCNANIEPTVTMADEVEVPDKTVKHRRSSEPSKTLSRYLGKIFNSHQNYTIT